MSYRPGPCQVCCVARLTHPLDTMKYVSFAAPNLGQLVGLRPIVLDTHSNALDSLLPYEYSVFGCYLLGDIC